MSMSRYEVFGESFLEVRRKMNRMADFFAWMAILIILTIPICAWRFADARGEDFIIPCCLFGGFALLFVGIRLYGGYQYKKRYLCTVSVESDGVTLYDGNGNFVRAFKFAECRGKMVEIDTICYTERKGRGAIATTILECLVLYRNEAVFDDCINETSLLPAYGALQKCEDAIVIHNPKAIKAIREQCALFLGKNGVVASSENQKAPNHKEPMREQFGKPLSLLYECISNRDVRFLLLGLRVIFCHRCDRVFACFCRAWFFALRRAALASKLFVLWPVSHAEKTKQLCRRGRKRRFCLRLRWKAVADLTVFEFESGAKKIHSGF